MNILALLLAALNSTTTTVQTLSDQASWFAKKSATVIEFTGKTGSALGATLSLARGISDLSQGELPIRLVILPLTVLPYVASKAASTALLVSSGLCTVTLKATEQRLGLFIKRPQSKSTD